MKLGFGRRYSFLSIAVPLGILLLAPSTILGKTDSGSIQSTMGGIRSNDVPKLNLDPNQQIQEVTEWLALGPFIQTASAGQTPIERWKDFLGPLCGKSEGNISTTDFKSCAANLGEHPWNAGRSPGSVLCGGPTNIAYFADAFELADVRPQGEVQTAYAACVIWSETERDVALFTASEDSLRVWVNGREATMYDGKREVLKFREVSIVHLRRGSNFVLAKVVGFASGTLGLWAAVETDIPDAIRRVADAWNQTLSPAWYGRPGGSLPVHVPVFGIPPLDVRLELQGRTVANATSGQSLTIPSSSASGVAYLEADIFGSTFRQPIFLGDPRSATNRYTSEFEALKDKPGAEHLHAALHRCEHLIEADHFEPADADWQRKFAAQAAIFEEASADIEAGKNPFHGRVGGYFRAYRSAIDGSLQYCYVYVPTYASRSGKPLPVVLLTPAVAEHVRPFLDSVYAANSPDWALFKLAEQFGCIVVLPGGRSNAYGNPIGLADMREAINSLGDHYSIDRNRVYVQGWCSGGMYALMLASFFPDDFAAVGVSIPLSVRDRNAYPAGSEQLPVQVPQDWLEANSPINFVPNLADDPLVIQYHDVEEKGYESPIFSRERKLYVTARKGAGLSTEVQQFRRPGYYRPDEYEAFYRFCLGVPPKSDTETKVTLVAAQTKYGEGRGLRLEEQQTPFGLSRIEVDASQPGSLEIAASNVRTFSIDLRHFGISGQSQPMLSVNGRTVHGEAIGGGWERIHAVPGISNPAGKSDGLEGPLSHLFSRPFLVTASQGDSQAAHAAKSWADAFRARWQKDFFCDCRYKPLENLTDEDRSSYDLLVFCADPKSALPDSKSDERLQVTPLGVKVVGRDLKGVGLGVLAMWRDPAHPDHYVAVASSNNFTQCRFPDVNFAFEGWFDYLVWRTDTDGHCKVLATGRFDRDWQ